MRRLVTALMVQLGLLRDDDDEGRVAGRTRRAPAGIAQQRLAPGIRHAGAQRHERRARSIVAASCRADARSAAPRARLIHRTRMEPALCSVAAWRMAIPAVVPPAVPAAAVPRLAARARNRRGRLAGLAPKPARQRIPAGAAPALAPVPRPGRARPVAMPSLKARRLQEVVRRLENRPAAAPVRRRRRAATIGSPGAHRLTSPIWASWAAAAVKSGAHVLLGSSADRRGLIRPSGSLVRGMRAGCRRESVAF